LVVGHGDDGFNGGTGNGDQKAIGLLYF
jgi:hypothetical protein